MSSIYLDNNATTRIAPEVLACLADALRQGYANPASQHTAGRRARATIEAARETIGRLLGASPSDQVVVTSGGTESNNMVIRGLGTGAGRSVAISAIEHPSLIAPAQQLKEEGVPLAWLPVDSSGIVQLEGVDQVLADPPAGQPPVISVMLGNHETGCLQPIAEIARRCRAAGAYCHTDATQAVGKIPVDFTALGVDALSCSAHKFHGPPGVGLLLLRQGVPLKPLLRGGFQQSGLRPGTESVALTLALQCALELYHQDATARTEQLSSLRDHLERALLNALPGAVIHARDVPRLPQTSSISLGGLDRQALMMALDRSGVACSTGSACASGSSEPSPVLRAMGLPQEQIRGAVRFSCAYRQTIHEMDQAVDRIVSVSKKLGIAAGA